MYEAAPDLVQLVDRVVEEPAPPPALCHWRNLAGITAMAAHGRTVPAYERRRAGETPWAFGPVRGQAPPHEACELCGRSWPRIIRIWWIQRRASCSACLACALLFGSQAGSKYKRVPRRDPVSGRLPPHGCRVGKPDDPDQHGVLFQEQPGGARGRAVSQPGGRHRIAIAAGYLERLVAENPVLAEMESDVEALLVNRLGPTAGIPPRSIICCPSTNATSWCG
jgi:hypothetical protein